MVTKTKQLEPKEKETKMKFFTSVNDKKVATTDKARKKEEKRRMCGPINEGF